LAHKIIFLGLIRIEVSMSRCNASPLPLLYWWKGENFWQIVWDRIWWYWEHPWGTHWATQGTSLKAHWKLEEHVKTHWEHGGNTKIKNFYVHIPLLSKPPRKLVVFASCMLG
jgi:hypothetical protein